MDFFPYSDEDLKISMISKGSENDPILRHGRSLRVTGDEGSGVFRLQNERNIFSL